MRRWAALIQTFFRSLFAQTLWNFERIQNVGFAFSIEPLLTHLGESKTVFRRMLRRQLMFFNCHPYFSPIVMGVVYNKEKARSDREEEDQTLTVLKDSMGGAFGAVGDHVIWGTWRPFAILTAMALGVLVASPTRSWSTCAQWWVVGFLCMFNAVHLWLRWRGLQKAAQDGPGVVRWVESLHLQAWASEIRRLGLLLLVVLVLVYLGRWAFSGFAIFYLVSAASLALGYFGVH
jgi:PTS system mannose-specific IID component